MNGHDFGTDTEIDNEVFGITEDDRVLDCDGAPMTEGDYLTIAVRNTLAI